LLNCRRVAERFPQPRRRGIRVSEIGLPETAKIGA
jgi:hypothetical protein